MINRILIGTTVVALSATVPMAVQAKGCGPNLRDAIDDTAVVREGDALSSQTYVDIAGSWVRPADGYPAIELGVRLTEPVPFRPDTNFNVLFLFDADGEVADNAPAGTRAGADTVFSLAYGLERGGWLTRYLTYDIATAEWVIQAGPEVLYAFDGGAPIMHVPYALMPEDMAWPWRVAVAVGDDGESRGDSYPDGEGELVICPENEEPTVISGTPKKGSGGQPAGADPAAPMGEESLPWWVYLWLFLVMAGAINFGVKSIRDIRDKATGSGMGDPEPTPPTEPTAPEIPEAPEPPVVGEPSAPISPPEREDDCDCTKCRLFLVIGSRTDRAVRSAANLGKAIKRDTLAAAGLDDEDRCVKVAHFTDYNLNHGRYVERREDGSLRWKRFRNRAVKDADDYGDVCLWKEVIMVHHGENANRVKRIIEQFRTLLPEQPIQRLVMYYCGGEGSLPVPEFRAMASSLGRRLKRIPERCRPDRVDIYMAPTIDFGQGEHFTSLLIEQTGLVSYDGLMKHYSVDQEGVITEHGNVRPPGGQIFGSVDLGRLGENDTLDAEAYRRHWREIVELPLSDIKRYRQAIEDAGLRPPAQTHKERQERGFRQVLSEGQQAQMSESDWDTLTDFTSVREAQDWLRNKFGSR